MKSRSQRFLDAVEAGDATLLPSAITREDVFMQALITKEVDGLVPITEEERYLLAIGSFMGGASGGGGTESGKKALAYFDMSKYDQYSVKPAQEMVDNFMDVTFADSRVFAIGMNKWSGGTSLYVYATTGKWIGLRPDMKRFISDGTLTQINSSGATNGNVEYQNSTLEILEVISRT